MRTDKIFQHFYFFCFIQRQHRLFMTFLRKLFQHFISYSSGRASGKHDSGLFFQLFQFIIQSVVFKIAHDFPVFLIIGFSGFRQKLGQLLLPYFLFVHVPLLLFSFSDVLLFSGFACNSRYSSCISSSVTSRY